MQALKHESIILTANFNRDGVFKAFKMIGGLFFISQKAMGAVFL